MSSLEPVKKHRQKHGVARAVDVAKAVRSSSGYARTLAEVTAILWLLCLLGYDARPALHSIGFPTAALGKGCCGVHNDSNDHDQENTDEQETGSAVGPGDAVFAGR